MEDFIIKLFKVKVNESRYIALFVVSGSTKKLFVIDFVSIYLSSMFFFNSFCQYLPFLNIFFNNFCQYLSFLCIFSIDFAW